ncbi:hypothetical protein OAZ19_00400 [bacterium]|nr:hypothetical protein [bacterium]
MILRALNITFLLIILSFFYQKANTGNFYNWDAIAYTMAVQLDEGKSTDEAHEYTYKTLKNEVDPGLFQTLCCTGKYRQDQFDSPGNLKSMMPMYALKPGYIALIKIVKLFTGLNEYQSMKYISIFSTLIMTLLFFITFFFQKKFLQFIWIPLVFFSQFLFLAKLMTPDAITALLFLISVMFLVKKKLYTSYLLMALTLSFRPDMIVAAGLAGLLPLINKDFRMPIFNSIIFLSIYFLISASISHNGWWSHFYTSLVSTQSNLNLFDPSFDLNKYFEILIGNTLWVLNDINYIVWFSLTFIIIFMSAYFVLEKKSQWINLIALSLSVAIIIKFIIFPKVDSRVYLAILVPAIYAFSLNSLNLRERIDSK